MTLEKLTFNSSTSPAKVGRVVTSFGQWRLIERWLKDERLLQPYVKWIFVNDKPDDPIPDDMKSRVELFGHIVEPIVNLGRCSARNLGVQALDTEWIDIIDGDDIHVQVQYGCLQDVGSVRGGTAH